MAATATRGQKRSIINCEDDPIKYSFYRYARMSTISSATIDKLTDYSVDDDTHGTELARLFSRLIVYYREYRHADLKYRASLVNENTAKRRRRESSLESGESMVHHSLAAFPSSPAELEETHSPNRRAEPIVYDIDDSPMSPVGSSNPPEDATEWPAPLKELFGKMEPVDHESQPEPAEPAPAESAATDPRTRQPVESDAELDEPEAGELPASPPPVEATEEEEDVQIIERPKRPTSSPQRQHTPIPSWVPSPVPPPQVVLPAPARPHGSHGSGPFVPSLMSCPQSYGTQGTGASSPAPINYQQQPSSPFKYSHNAPVPLGPNCNGPIPVPLGPRVPNMQLPPNPSFFGPPMHFPNGSQFAPGPCGPSPFGPGPIVPGAFVTNPFGPGTFRAGQSSTIFFR
ncbi:hypothetical protein PFISCL1PPCAC_11131 [Pristionchus fissidentatus]|uniref:Uncharacterized protein n=1 Tax=Pristionchus fissidentatus TaxID=1538716 RepID=A0AAV5VJY6_9BILA|nr:hypothetical protein PFISCL1PPCAC_11131 [Pristionchus fissidentatus]